MKIGATGAWNMFQTHLIIATKSTLELQEYLLTEGGYTFYSQGKATQDVAESGFSNVRSNRPKPSALDFKFRFKQLCVVGQDDKISRSSYHPDSTPSLIDVLRKMKPPVAFTTDVIGLPSPQHCPELSQDLQVILYKLCGYVVFKLKKNVKCQGCLQSLEGSPYGEGNPHRLSGFVDCSDFLPCALQRVSGEVDSIRHVVEKVMWNGREKLEGGFCCQESSVTLK